jgi:hypothetical protein
MQAVTDVSEMAQELMSVCEDAMAIINCQLPTVLTQKVMNKTRRPPRSTKPLPVWEN